MKHLPLLLFIILLSISDIIFSMNISIEDATRNINKQSKEVAQSATSTNIANLVNLLENYQDFLIFDEISSIEPTVQSNFIDAWGTAADAIKQAAYKTSEGYDPRYGGDTGYNYQDSDKLLTTATKISAFNNIAENLQDFQAIQVLANHLKTKDPKRIFKNIYYTHLYHWLTYKALYQALEHRGDSLKTLIGNYPTLLSIDTKDSELMNELKRELQILQKLLNYDVLPQQDQAF